MPDIERPLYFRPFVNMADGVASRGTLGEGGRLLTRVLHFGVHCFQALRRSGWFVSRPRPWGVHGIPLTPDGKVVLVTLSYAKGWRLPGGGQKLGEDSREGLLRELREEIGLTSYSSVELVSGFTHRPEHRRGRGSLFVVRGVERKPCWSIEVREVGEFDLNELPAGTAAITREFLALAQPQLTWASASDPSGNSRDS